MNNLIKRTWQRKELVFVEDLRGMAFTQEDGAHTFSIAGKDENGADLALSGTVAGSLIRPDGTTTGMTGTIADGCANLTLSPECYGVSGRASLTIFLTSGGQKTAIYHAVMSIGKSSTSQVSPGVAADVVDLVNRIDTATASIPATYTALLGSIASDYSSDVPYPTVGTPVWYSGKLYRSKVPITTAETWTAAHWNQVVLADSLNADITSLKSALDYSDYDIAKNAVIVSGLYISNTGVLVALSSGTSDRMVCIKALPNCIYRIKKSTSTVMRAGCLATDSPAASMGLVNFTSHAQASSDELIVRTGDDTRYIYIQLFVSGDTPGNINDNLASLQVIPDIIANHNYDMAYRAAYDKANLEAITDGAISLFPLSNAGISGGVTFEIYGGLLCMNGNTTGVLVRNISEPMELAAGTYTLSNAGIELPAGVNLQVRDVTGGGNVSVAQTRTNTIFTLNTTATCLMRIYIPAGVTLIDAIARPAVIAGQKPPIYSANDRTVRDNALLRLIGTQTQSFSASSILSQGDNIGQALTVMSYNVAHYNNDTSTEISGQRLLNFRRMLGRYNADIVGVQEDSIYLDDGQTKDSRTYLWNPLYPRKAGGNGPAIHAKKQITNTGTCNFTTGQYLVYGIITMGDNTVLVVSAHPVSHTHGSDEDRASQYRELIQWCSGEIQLPSYPSGTLTSAPVHTHVIVCMDANSRDDTDKSNLALAVGDDYIMANGGIYGWFISHFKGNRSAIDNIIVSKNVIINDVECLEEWYDQLYSDHAPVVVKITLL